MSSTLRVRETECVSSEVGIHVLYSSPARHPLFLSSISRLSTVWPGLCSHTQHCSALAGSCSTPSSATMLCHHALPPCSATLLCHNALPPCSATMLYHTALPPMQEHHTLLLQQTVPNTDRQRGSVCCNGGSKSWVGDREEWHRSMAVNSHQGLMS